MTTAGKSRKPKRLIARATASLPERSSIRQVPRRAGLAEYVYGHIKDLILDGHFVPGQTIPVDQLAGQLSVSRQPVTDALKRLSLEGFLVIFPQIGCCVRQYETDEVGDFFRLFAEGEALVAELLVERANVEDIANLEVISAQIGVLRTSMDGPDEISRKYRHLNRRLHFEMRRAARSPSVTEVVETLGDRSDFFIAASRKPLFADRLQTAHDEHEAIIAAVRRRDPGSAREIMKQHILGIDLRIRGR
ncbi:GntR family transcriptional regulator [Chelatococcus asaccharovorans]|uniref:GntR family transcriptional regulator n=1 Tax=Chelatococcus asaccharovorans TaxID=28210 RepID=A0A2V3TUR2_9HYPH|nr:GntR family transcriptional regulator [Chelatococcus asaccharovorans]MBS7706125.1 GntR family transcriptional regulator [Chelatococcus asaccharovorans]PXW52495.1 GntR family transcriptional regulator [Chelatococcus asaccharovorans]CAH1659421.1 GntR family transcriptional regulator [Chelatococcus asaccharovorans]CAH1687954.1 GntR family transcriptional regulator [Chelatococcus asaccharovorans]